MAMAPVLIGCSGAPRASGEARADRNLITRDEMLARSFTNVHDALESMRSNWLRPRGTDSFSSPTEVQVYLDNVRMGGVGTLRSLSCEGVKWVRFYDGITATGRWGLGHGQGVIYVSTHE